MWHYLFLLLRRQPGKNALASGGFLLAACALVLLSATTQTTALQSNQIISQNWRSTYDLVVLPPHAPISGQTTIPSDVLAGYHGGISMEQYAQIKQLPGIAVAAPIAYLGYLDLPSPVIHLTNDVNAPGYYREDWTQTSFNGQRQIVERHESDMIFLDGSNVCHLSFRDPAVGKQYNDRVAAFDKKGIVYACAPYSDAIETHYSPVTLHTSPLTEKFLLAAIDPDAENQLVHLDANVSKGRMLTEQDTKRLQFEGTSPSGQENYTTHIPILVHAQLPGQATLHFTYARLSADGLTSNQALARGGAYLRALPDQQVFVDQNVPAAEHDADLFSSLDLFWDGHSWQRKPPNPQFYALFGSLQPTLPSSLKYQPVTGPAGSVHTAYRLVPIGTQGPEVTFRDLTIQNTVAPQVGLYLDPIGQFTDTHLSAQFSNPLNWLPESTYAVPPTILHYDAQGNPLSPTALLPTTNAAGYVIQPPLALTTLAAARQLQGDRLINAIRVRVSDVDAANPASWRHIQQVAGLIRQRTGLLVQVTLGSSPRPTLVYVPGVKQGQFGATQNIAPVGWVEERWIAIGASILYITQLGATRLLLIGAVLAVCLGYLVVAFSALLTAQRKDFAVLSALGWRPWQPARLFLAQALLLALVGGIVGIALALLIARVIEAIPIWLIVAWTLPTMLLLAVVSSLHPLWQIWRLQPAEILRAGSSILTSRTRVVGQRLGALLPSITALVLRNLARSRPRTLVTIASLFLSAVLLIVMFSGILSLRQTLMGTLLGDYVLFQTAVPQIAGCVFALLLTFLSVADLLLLQVRERQQEIGLLQALGWQAREVRRLFVQEGVLLAIIGTVPGVLVAQWVLVMQHSTQQLISPLALGLGAVLLMVLVAGLATLPALRAINRMKVIHVLRAE